MPRFDYQCKNCFEDFEYLTVRSDDYARCPKCFGVNLKKKVSLFSVGNSKISKKDFSLSKKSESSTISAERNSQQHTCHSKCNHSKKSSKQSSCGKAQADTLRKKYGYR